MVAGPDTAALAAGVRGLAIPRMAEPEEITHGAVRRLRRGNSFHGRGLSRRHANLKEDVMPYCTLIYPAPIPSK